MSILVVCPGCKKSFQVADKFAGKSGPCPKCKATIRVPAKSEEVKVHSPGQFSRGGRTAGGELALKPISRKEVLFQPVMAAGVAGAIVGLLAVILAARGLGLVAAHPIVWCAIGLLAVSPVLALAAYTFLRDDELEPYRGLSLYIRSAACAAAYVVLWALFAYVRYEVKPGDQIFLWVLITAPVVVLGSLAAWVSLDLEPGNSFFHYVFYLLVTAVLGWVAGLGWVWEVSNR
ncbi:MAG: hypothetical protein ABR915_06180 [Thermoguttaceae bacterium]|jgi:hypothetical protein